MKLRSSEVRAGLSTPLAVALACPRAAGADDTNAPAPASGTTTTVTTTTVTTTSALPSSSWVAPPWTLAALPDEPVPFHGMVPANGSGMGPGAMLYPTTPALGVIGLLVGIATHAALVAGSRSSQESKAQLDADKILDPYRDALAGFRLRDLEQRSLSLSAAGSTAHLRGVDEAPAGDVLVRAVPVFSMTPDAAALVLDEVVVVRPSGAPGNGSPQSIRVVSTPRLEEDLQAAWTADNAAALKSTAAALMAESLDIVLAQLSRPAVDDKAPYRTLRYVLGDEERMERAQLVRETCDHLLIRNLRGDLLSVPHRPGDVLPDGCPTPPVAPARVAVPVVLAAASAAAAAAPATPAGSAPDSPAGFRSDAIGR